MQLYFRNLFQINQINLFPFFHRIHVNYCQLKSSLLLNIAMFMFFEHRTHGKNENFRSFRFIGVW